jgi:hypothetical protein
MLGLSSKNESLSEQMVRAYDRFLSDHHLVETREEEEECALSSHNDGSIETLFAISSIVISE